MDNQDTNSQPSNKPNLGGLSSQNPSTPKPLPNIPQVISNNQKPKKKWPKILAVLIVVLLAVGAWYFFIRKDNTEQPAQTAPSKEIAQLNIGLVSPDYGGIYPDMPVANSYSSLTNAQMFEGLVRYEDKSKIVPLLATDWSNPDNKTWVFNLKPNINFHNGNMLKAADVKYSIDTIKNSGTEFAETFSGTIENVRVINDNQVEIKTKEPDPALLNRLAFLYIIDANAPEGSEPSLAGTGPYQIKTGTTPTKSEVQMTAFNQYHDGNVTTKALTFGSAENVEELVKGYNEEKFNIIGPTPLNDAEDVLGATQFVSSEPEVSFLGMNSIKPGPLRNKEVRSAIRYAVDPELLGEAQGDKVTPISQLIPPSIPGYDPAITPYKRDVNKSKELLTQAGFPNGVTIKFSHNSDKELADELARQLKEAGITLIIDFQADFSQFIDYFSSGQAEMYYIVYASDILDGLDIYRTTLTSTKNYENAELNAKLDEAGSTVDREKRLKLLQEAAIIIDRDVAVVPLSTRDAIWLMDKDYKITQDMPSSLISVYFSKVQLK